jgi:hypothetical protein
METGKRNLERTEIAKEVGRKSEREGERMERNRFWGMYSPSEIIAKVAIRQPRSVN